MILPVKYLRRSFIKTLKLVHPVIFIEFYVRAIEFLDKNKVKNIPDKNYYNTGKSFAENIKYFDFKIKKWKTEYDKYFGFKNNIPVVKKGFENKVVFSDKIKNCYLLAKEYFEIDEKKWYRAADQIIMESKKIKNKYGFKLKSLMEDPFLPYGLKIYVKKNGDVSTTFPRLETNLDVNKAYAYLCHREQYQMIGQTYIYPNIYLVLFIKNYGFHNYIKVLDSEEFSCVDSSNLCLDNNIKIRDFRKSKNKYEF